MDDFMNKEDRENLKKLNRYLGTSHRTRPYDMKNPDDIIEATIMATAEYVDLAHYWSTLSHIEELFDETMEVFHPSTWVNKAKEGKASREDLIYAAMSLGETTDLFYQLMLLAEKSCTRMWRIIFYHGEDRVKAYFFGEAREYDEEDVERVLEGGLFDVFAELEYDGVIENSAHLFSRKLEAMISG